MFETKRKTVCHFGGVLKSDTTIYWLVSSQEQWLLGVSCSSGYITENSTCVDTIHFAPVGMWFVPIHTVSSMPSGAGL